MHSHRQKIIAINFRIPMANRPELEAIARLYQYTSDDDDDDNGVQSPIIQTKKTTRKRSGNKIQESADDSDVESTAAGQTFFAFFFTFNKLGLYVCLFSSQ